eukprot:TRINITY_DN268_c0_g1_i1.p1 TRINITY_DN268_c0_g1~~TRINITY_DN268_c0_g1_i1.p1  ORF type:complete len:229 (+),score=58.00 TRINITY_DN268_c0_g1_i1:24-689(+)
MIRRPPRSTQSRSSAASDVYKRQINAEYMGKVMKNDSTGGPSLDELKYKESDSLQNSNREYSQNKRGRSSFLNSSVSLNSIIEDPSKEDVHSSESNSHCIKTPAANLFITNEELKTPTTTDISIVGPCSTAPSKVKVLDAKEEAVESLDSNVKAKEIVDSLAVKVENKTVNLKEKEVASMEKRKKMSLHTLKKSFDPDIKLERSKSCCCFSNNIEHACIII